MSFLAFLRSQNRRGEGNQTSEGEHEEMLAHVCLRTCFENPKQTPKLDSPGDGIIGRDLARPESWGPMEFSPRNLMKHKLVSRLFVS